MSDQPPTRAQLAAAASLTAVLVAYASLGPLRLHVALPVAWRALAETWPPVLGSKTDFLSNVLLQVPVGFLIAGALAADRPARRWIAAGAALVLGCVLAIAIEIVQVSVPSRTPQSIDVVAETMGALGGAVAWMLAGDVLLAVVRRWWQRQGSPWLAAWLIYTAVWTLWQWVPFDFTIRPAEIAGKLRAGMIALGPLHEPPHVVILAGAIAILAAWPVGVAAERALDGRPRSWAVLVAGAWIVLTAVGQVAVLSRSTSAVSIVAAIAGSTLGVLFTTPRAMPRVVG